MFRLVPLLIFAALSIEGVTVARAQAPSAAAATSPATSPATTSPAAAPAPDSAQINELVRTINDPAARVRLTEQLNLLAAAQAQSKPPSADFGSRLLQFLSAQIGEAADEFGALGKAFVGLPTAGLWVEHQLADPVTRSHWEQLAAALALVLAAGAATIWIANLAIRSPRRSIEQHGGHDLLGRFLFAGIRLMLESAPIGLFGVVSYVLLPITNPPVVVAIATITIVNATMLVLGIVAASRFLFSPAQAGLRLVPIGDEGARFFHRWVCWIGGVIAFGWFGISAARVLGLPRVAAQAAFKIVGLVVTVILLALVFGKRREVARWIRGREPGGPADAIRGPRLVAFRSTRRRLAEVWHLLAAAYLVVIFAIWALDLKGGFDFVLTGTLISAGVVAAARLAVLAVDRLAERSLGFSQANRERYPRLQAQIGRYAPIARATIVATVWLIALLTLVDIWGIDAFAWFRTPGGGMAVAKTASILLVVVGAVVAWELVSAIIERYLMGAVHDGSPIQRSQRVRTLLPLLRNAFLIFLIVVVLLIILSEIGLNIAPLLAGAGVVGLAIGFGAQTLVKDVITGIFILFENTIAVGDVVDVGGGHSGLVEAFSIRTMKLRDTAGSVHTVPFSAVTSVVNMTKDFAYYVFNIKVDYGQDTDRVVDVVKALGAELQEDPAFSGLILAPIEIIGLDSFASDAMVLQARFKTKPIQQWTVGREFNRRMKKRFDALNIPLSFSQSMVVTTRAAAGQADPAMPPPAAPAPATLPAPG